VRELRNVVERAAVMVRGRLIEATDLHLPEHLPPTDGDASAEGDLDLPGAVARLERAMIAAALQAADGNRTKAARRLGIQRQLLYAKLERYGLAGTTDGEVSPDTTTDVGKDDDSGVAGTS
jgi:DNA-binding NtrC family response regulator